MITTLLEPKTEVSMSDVKKFQDLWVYQAAFEAAMEIFEHSKGWPKEERYALTDQIRRASRSVCANVAEAWRKRRYPKHFITKLSHADAEAAEVQCWLEFAQACGYLSAEDAERLTRQYHRITAGLVKMMTATDKWCGPANLAREPGVLYSHN